jgi:nucleoside-diphosphate-sugar epimerase
VKILVTGAAGFIGSHLTENLARLNHDVTAVDSFSNVIYPKDVKLLNIQNFQELNVNFHNIDLTKDDLSQIVMEQDIIINQAGIPGLTKSWEYLDEYLESNVFGLNRLLTAAKSAKIQRFIQISTSSVYGKEATGDENSIKSPYSPYGVTKLAAENLARAYESNFGIPVVVLRYFSVYGPRQRPDMAYFKLIQSVLQNQTFNVYGNGEQTRTNTYVDDIIEGTIQSMSLSRNIDGMTFNLSGNEKYSLMNVIEIIEEFTGKRASLKFEPTRHGDQVNTKGEIKLANEFLGYSPSTNLRQGLASQLNWQIDAILRS